MDDILEIAVDANDQDLGRSDQLSREVMAELTAQADDERRSGLAAAMPCIVLRL